MARLEKSLEGIRVELERQIALAEQQQARADKSQDAVSKDRRQLAEEAKRRKQTPGAVGQGGAATTPAESEALGQAAAREAAQRRRLAATLRQEALARRELVKEQRLLNAAPQRPLLGQAQDAEQVAAAEERLAAARSRYRFRGEPGAAQARERLDAARGRYGGFGPPPPPPPRPPVGGGGGGDDRSGGDRRSQPRGPDRRGGGGILDEALGADKAARLAAEQQRLLTGSLAAARGQTVLNDEIGRSSRTLGLADNAYRKHGALTTEFINAAAKGHTTFRELGYQVSTTIGKFAGWTAAASAVYGALGAITALGHGAIASASGVALLDRVTTKKLPGGDDALQARFRGLSAKFNLPIDDVTAAAYGSAKAFGGDLPQALKATEQALFAVKVGELSVGDATGALNAIIRGFRLSAEELPAVFDTINAATNKFGGNAGDLVKATARAAGSFRNAGGNQRQLISLLVSGSKTTGKTFLEVATAVQRSVQRTLTPAGADALRAVGLDPTLKYTDLIEQAAKAVKEAHSPQEAAAIAKALVPSQGAFTPTFLAILNDPDRRKRLQDLAPDKVKGSATKELENALKALDERIKSIANRLQQLGSSLAQAGGLNVLGLFIDLLSKSLSLATSLLDVFNNVFGLLNHIPIVGHLIYQSLLPALEIALVLRGLRRLDLGGSLPQGRPGGVYEAGRRALFRSPDSRAGALIGQGVGDHRRFLEDERRSAAQSAARAQFAAQRAFEDDRAAGSRVLAHPVGTPGREHAEGEAAAAHRDYEKAQERATKLERDQAYAARKIGELKAQELRYQQLRRTGLSHEVAATRAGIIYRNPTLDRPTAEAPVVLPGARGGGPAPTPSAPDRVRAAVAAAARAAERQTAATAGAAASAAATRTAAAEAEKAARAQITNANAASGALLRLGGTAGDTDKAAKRTSIASGAARGSLSAAGRAFGVARAGLGGVATGLRNLYGQLGTLDKALIGVVGAYLIYQSGQAAEKAADQAVQAARRKGQEPDALRAQEKKARDKLAELEHPGLNPLSNFSTRIHDLPHDLTFGLFGSSTKDRLREAADTAKQERERVDAARAQGKLLKLGPIKANFQRRLAAARNDKEVEAALAYGRQQLAESYAVKEGGKDAKRAAALVRADFNAKAAELKAARGDLEGAAKAITDLASLGAFVQQTSVAYARTGSKPRNFAASAAAVTAARTQAAAAAQSGDNEKAAAALQAGDKAKQDALTQAQSDLDRVTSFAPPAAQSRARDVFLARIKQVYVDNAQQQVDTIDKDIDKRNAEIATAQKQLQALVKPSFGKGGIAAAPQIAPGDLAEKVRKLKDKVANLEQQRKGAEEDLVQAQKLLADIQRQQRRQQFEADRALYDAVTSARVAQIADPVAGAREQLRRTNAYIARIAKEYGKQSQEYQNAIATAAQQQSALVNAELDQFQQKQEVARSAANIGASDQAKLEGAVTDAKAYLGEVKGKKNIDPSRVRQAEILLNNALAARLDYVKQNTDDLAAARLEYQLSLTEDPVARARLEYNAAKAKVKTATTPTERFRALADENNKRRSLQQTIQNERASQIDFDLSIEKIDKDTAIAKYEALLKTIKGNRDLKRQIQQRIHDLKKEGETGALDLALGDIKLPTVYEVRRAIDTAQAAVKAGGGAGANVRDLGVTKNSYTGGGNTVNVVVNGPQDYEKLGQVLEQHVNGTAKGMQRAGLFS